MATIAWSSDLVDSHLYGKCALATRGWCIQVIFNWCPPSRILGFCPYMGTRKLNLWLISASTHILLRMNHLSLLASTICCAYACWIFLSALFHCQILAAGCVFIAIGLEWLGKDFAGAAGMTSMICIDSFPNLPFLQFFAQVVMGPASGLDSQATNATLPVLLWDWDLRAVYFDASLDAHLNT